MLLLQDFEWLATFADCVNTQTSWDFLFAKIGNKGTDFTLFVMKATSFLVPSTNSLGSKPPENDQLLMNVVNHLVSQVESILMLCDEPHEEDLRHHLTSGFHPCQRRTGPNLLCVAKRIGEQ